ncbi:carbohydrate ABC transporter permease [Streptomyces sp. NPDC086835]|uniref:carbohydrate ABC transporter permease n=1 Tax=Streptomyces sp. NPDC086835 TaxID=3365761 RepID=UPI00381CCB55
MGTQRDAHRQRSRDHTTRGHAHPAALGSPRPPPQRLTPPPPTGRPHASPPHRPTRAHPRNSHDEHALPCQTSADYRTNGSLSWPEQWNWGIISDVWERVDFTQKLVNSIQISLGVVLIAVVFALFNAYAIGIGRVRRRTAFLVFFLGVNVLPQEGLVYPIYYLFKEMGLYDGKLGYTILVGITYSAFGTYLLSSVFSSFPRELVEAASMDGAGRWTILWRIVLPMSWPTLSVMCVFFFVWSWNEFLYPLVLLISNDNQTVPLGLSVMQGQYTSDPTAMSAAALLGVIPMIAFFLLFQRSLTRGLTAGAVK